MERGLNVEFDAVEDEVEPALRGEESAVGELTTAECRSVRRTILRRLGVCLQNTQNILK